MEQTKKRPTHNSVGRFFYYKLMSSPIIALHEKK